MPEFDVEAAIQANAHTHTHTLVYVMHNVHSDSGEIGAGTRCTHVFLWFSMWGDAVFVRNDLKTLWH